MIRLVAAASLLLFTGMTLVLSEVRWFRTRSLTARLSPYLPGGSRSPVADALSFDTMGQLLRPLVEASGDLAARLFGVSEELPRRLRRVHSPLDPASFRLRQLGWSIGSVAAAVIIGFSAALPGPLIVMGFVTAPLLAFLVIEQQLANASDQWKRRTFHELPVVAEQIAMLLGSGYSLGAALTRIADRGSGVVAADLTRVVARVRQGISESAALEEWADLVDVDAVTRLVAILALNKEAGDLGGLVAAEARVTRAEAHRSLIERIEKKNQQVWIPVTLATLVPGVLLMAVPFFDALRAFGT
ncbi:MAG: type II secretion system F family protein [Acidimicrobiales bacterium]